MNIEISNDIIVSLDIDRCVIEIKSRVTGSRVILDFEETQLLIPVLNWMLGNKDETTN